MILSLSIKNYALIEDIRVGLDDGLTIITGETGAGKSILLGALALLMGKRADSTSVKDATLKCVVEGEFALKNYDLSNVFSENDLDYDDNTIIRREILPSGKSRAFVNDTPVSLAQLQALGEHLVDIHSQNETRSFASEEFQLEVLDALGGNFPVLKNYENVLSEYNDVSKVLDAQIQLKNEALKELDYNTFLQNELAEANLSKLNQEELEDTFNTLDNAETIEASFASLMQLFSHEEIGTIETAKEARSFINKISAFTENYKEIYERLNSVVIELEDIYEAAERASQKVEADPSELATINDRLQVLYKLQQKHNVNTVEDLIAIETELSSKIDTTLHLDTIIEKLTIKKESLYNELKTLAEQLHTARKKAVSKLLEKLKVYLDMLGLPNAQFEFDIKKVGNFRFNGADSLQVNFTANKGSSLGAIKKVASGGEMSRIMLSVKAVLAKYKKLPTLVFDEIDTGVSGEIALKMAAIMGEMSKEMQLISITHLPQIASKGAQHIKVFKEDINNKTVTQMKQLTDEERIVEIAQMISGNKITDTALANARELLN
ncbi:MAG: DNA repair protein RecN [Patiriisocius sp.]|uniref:DNA repair protein RecN n=1 Tax=Patiriisocius sp. TaxID=2822396 RepID=UPI003EF4ABF6